MKTKYVFMASLCLISFLLSACKRDATTKPDSKAETTTAPAGTSANPTTTNISNNSNTETTTAPINNIPTTGTTVIDPPAPEPLASISSLCGNVNFDIKKAVLSSANSLKDIMYSRNPEDKADCSGIFHRVLTTFKTPCPDAKVPTFGNARDSRSLAAWYNKNGHFKIIRNPAKNANLIQSGAVMFYGYGNRRKQYDFQKMNMDTLTTRNIGINHISIVTSVNRVNGELISYKMFHGRSDNKPSAETNSYKVTPYDKTLPMYGNHKEPWIGWAQPFGNK